MKTIDAGHEVVVAAFITPYPPRFPVLVPGQVITRGWGTLSPATYDPATRQSTCRRPGYRPNLDLSCFVEQTLSVRFLQTPLAEVR